jgi:hypothetical protein
MKKPTRRQWIALAALLVLLLTAVTAWAAWPNGKVKRAKQLQQELTGPLAQSLPPEERRQKWQEYRETTKQLTPAQRRELTAERDKRRRDEMTRYFSLSAAEKTRYLDERIAQTEQRRQAREAQGGTNGGPGGGPGGGPRGATGGPAGGPGTGGPAANNPQDVGSSKQARDQWRMDRLDSTTPADRAQMTQFMADLNARRAQLGLPTRGPGGR